MSAAIADPDANAANASTVKPNFITAISRSICSNQIPENQTSIGASPSLLRAGNTARNSAMAFVQTLNNNGA
jgi:hypothetical protein